MHGRPGRPAARRSTAPSSSSGASDDAERFAVGAVLLVDGEPAEIVVSKRVGGGRPVIGSTAPVERGARRWRSARAELPACRRGRVLRLRARRAAASRRRAAARSASSRDVLPGLRTTCSSSTRALLAAARRGLRARRSTSTDGRRRRRPGFADLTANLRRRCDSTSSPWFRMRSRWLTEQRPLAAVLGTSSSCASSTTGTTTPLRAGQVDDEPYGGGAGMVLRVDVVAAALERSTATRPASAGDRADAAGPAARPGARRGARARSRR